MSDTEYRIKCSKRMICFVSIGWGVIGGGIFIALIILAICGIISPNDINGTDISGDIFGLIFSSLCLIFVISAVSYAIWKYKKVLYIYQKDKVIRMNGDKEKYILYYKNIVSIKESAFGSIYIFCREPIYINGKK